MRLLLLLLVLALGCQKDRTPPPPHIPDDAKEEILSLVHAVYGQRSVELTPVRDGLIEATFLDEELALLTLRYEFERGHLIAISTVKRKTP